MSAGETDLERLLHTMSPTLTQGEYVFCSLPGAGYGDHATLEPIAMMREAEGLTLVVPRARAEEAGIPFDGAFRCITLQVHSSLDAVGLTAAFAACLTDHGLSANVIAGYYHDHIFVQSAEAERALAALESLTR